MYWVHAVTAGVDAGAAAPGGIAGEVGDDDGESAALG